MRIKKSGQFWVPPWLRNREAKLLGFLMPPPNAFEEFPDGLGCDAKPPGNLLVCHSLGFKPTEQSLARMRDSRAIGWVAAGTAQGSKAATFQSALISPHAARRTAEGSRDLILTGPALFDEANHRVGLGHLIADGILCQRNAGNDHNPIILFRTNEASIIYQDGGRCIGWFGKEAPLSFVRSCHSRRLEPGGPEWRAKKRTVLGPPLRYAKTNKNGVIGTLCQEI